VDSGVLFWYDPMKIAIVVDMWLTGFDVPSLNTIPLIAFNVKRPIQRIRYTAAHFVFSDEQ
jgi:hypothetical protein